MADLLQQQMSLIAGGGEDAGMGDDDPTTSNMIGDMMEFVAKAVPPEEHKNISTDYAAAESLREGDSRGLDARAQLYEDLKSGNTKLLAAKEDLINKMSTGQSMSKSQVAAMMLIGILPTLIGGALKGKKGLAKGAEAGALGATTMAKGLESDALRSEKRDQNKLDAIDSQLGKNEELLGKAKLDEINASDSAMQKQLDRENSLNVAGIRASGESAGLQSIGKSLNNIAAAYKVEKLGQESEATKAGFTLDGNNFIMPTKSVKPEVADKVREAAVHYSTALENLQAIKEMGTGMDLPTIQRSMGDPSSDMYQKYVIAQNSLMDVKKIPGLKGTEAVSNMDKLLSNPTNLIKNLWAKVPGTATVEGDITSAYKNILQDYERLTQMNGYQRMTLGQAVVVNGKKGTFKGLGPSGRPMIDFGASQ